MTPEEQLAEILRSLPGCEGIPIDSSPCCGDIELGGSYELTWVEDTPDGPLTTVIKSEPDPTACSGRRDKVSDIRDEFA